LAAAFGVAVAVALAAGLTSFFYSSSAFLATFFCSSTLVVFFGSGVAIGAAFFYSATF